MISTLALVGKSYKLGTPKLVAHEIGHLLGSDHDGDQPTSGSFYGQRRWLLKDGWQCKEGEKEVCDSLIAQTNYQFYYMN